MKICNIISKLLLIFSIFSCSKPTNELYSTKSVDVIQVNCEQSIKEWINKYADSPDSYTSLMFEKVVISSAYNKSTEIMPLRRYALEHTFVIRNKDSNNTHVTLQFELTPDYFVQDVRYKQAGVVTLAHRIFPPKYELWSELYGRTLTIEDSLSWEANNREILYQLSSKLYFNRYVDPEGENAVLTDTLVAQLNRYYFTN